MTLIVEHIEIVSAEGARWYDVAAADSVECSPRWRDGEAEAIIVDFRFSV
jgi:hypothetical protein